MKYEWLDDYCLSKKGTTKDYQIDWEAFRFFVGDKMFILLGADNTGKPIITLKSDPLVAYQLRSDYEDIAPGYHMNKTHWNSVYLEGSVPDEILKRMIDMSYDLVLNKMSKKKQMEIRGDFR